MDIKDQPCVWFGGSLCHTSNTTMCEPFDYAMNGEGHAFTYFHAKNSYVIAGCKTRGQRP